MTDDPTRERIIESVSYDLGREIWLQPGQKMSAKILSRTEGDRTIVFGYEIWIRPTQAHVSDTPIETIAESTQRTLQHQADRIKALLADAAEQRARAERAIFVGETNDASYDRMRTHFDKTLAAAEARVAALETALRVIAESDEWGMARRVARAALAASAPAEATT